MYDLAWAATNPAIVGRLDAALLRRLVVLKIWVDANGVHGGGSFWKPGHEGPPFDPDDWLRFRGAQDFDVDDIGALMVPVPTPDELADTVRSQYGFLADLDPTEQIIARASQADRALVLHALAGLPGHRLKGIGLY